MKITPEKATRARELVGEIRETWDELKGILTKSMNRHERERFKAYAMGHFEGALSEDYGWIGNEETIEDMVQQAEDDAEAPSCKKCSSAVGEDGYCTNEDCFHSDHEQSEGE